MATNGRPQDAWRKPAATGPAAGPRAPAGGATTGKRRWLPAALAVAVLGGAVVGLFVYLGRPPAPLVVAIPVTRYDHPDWPADPFAEADAKGLTDHFPDHGVLAHQSQQKTAFLKQLDDRVAAANKEGRPLLVYVVALGTVLDGTPYLLPGDALPGYNPSGWLTLDEMLAPLMKATGPRLLVLDVRPVFAPRATLPTGDVNAHLGVELKKLDDANQLPFFVLNANTPAGGPVVLTPLKRTAFGLAVGHALGGAADGWNGGVRDNDVKAKEFIDHVTASTAASTAAFGGPTQVPHLFGKGSDFHLTGVPRGGAEPLPGLPEVGDTDPDPYPDDLARAWKAADAAVRDGVDRRAPRPVQQLVRAAVRGEQRWRAGLDAKAVSESLKDVLPLDPAKYPPVIVRPLSIARAAGLPGYSPADVERAADLLRPAFEVIADRELDPMKKPDVLKAAQAKVKEYKPDPPPPPAEKGKPEPPPPAPPLRFEAVAEATLNAVRRLEKPTREQVAQMLQTANQFPTKRPLAELVPLEMVAGVSNDTFRNCWPAGSLVALLNATAAGEKATAGDPRFLPWVQDKLTAADANRRAALKTLCNPRAETPDIEKVLKQLDDAGAGYNECANLLDALRVAQTEAENTRAALDDLAVLPLPVSGLTPEAWEKSVTDLTDAYLELSDLLRFPPVGLTPGPNKLTVAAERLKAAREVASGQVAGPKNPTVREAERAFHWPWWKWEERSARLGEFRTLTRAATGRALAATPAVPASPPTPTIGGAPSDSLRHLRMEVALLRLVEASRAEAEGLKVPTGANGFAGVAAKARALRGRVTPPPGDKKTPELDEHRVAEKELAAWLEKHRYRGDADVIRKYPFPGGTDPAKRLDDLADACAK